MSWVVPLVLGMVPAVAVQNSECSAGFGPPDLPPALLEQCGYLGWAESLADLAGGEAVDEYEARLSEWRQLDMKEQPACRLRSLSMFLLNGARNLPALFNDEDLPLGVKLLYCYGSDGLSASEKQACEGLEAEAADSPLYWEHYVSQELLLSISDPWTARCFAEWYVPRGILPSMFSWPEIELSNEVASILADGEYDTVYAAGGHMAPHYGAPQVLLHEGPRGRKLRSKRAIHLVHYRNMRGVFKGFNLEQISQVWEFGVGQGDFAAMLRDLNYKGTYLGYDLVPVLLFAGYWLRYSGLPALLGARLPPSPDAVRNRTVLESSRGSSVFDHLDRDRLGEMLFVSFESISEATKSDQERVWPWLRQCGFIIMTFEEIWYGDRDNVLTFTSLAKDLEATHSVLVWRSPKPALEKGAEFYDRTGNFGKWVYFTAARRDLAEVACAPPSSCTAAALHPAFSS